MCSDVLSKFNLRELLACPHGLELLVELPEALLVVGAKGLELFLDQVIEFFFDGLELLPKTAALGADYTARARALWPTRNAVGAGFRHTFPAIDEMPDREKGGQVKSASREVFDSIVFTFLTRGNRREKSLPMRTAGYYAGWITICRSSPVPALTVRTPVMSFSAKCTMRRSRDDMGFS